MRSTGIRNYGLAIAALALLVALGLPGQAVEGASTAVTSAVDALKLSKQANKRSKRALKVAKEARGNAAGSQVPGPQGPKGDQGSNGGQGPAGPGVLYGRAPAAESRTLLISWPAMGLEVRTHDVSADSVFEVRIVNTNPAGGAHFRVVTGGLISSVLAGGEGNYGGLAGVDALVVENGGSGRMVELNCFANVIAAGDDNFMQCMGVVAGPG